ncbi:hypothetical protein RhiirA5_432418 [Rhizophagus irregularis]|uniref:Ion transport domain-containing protein n=1 Tax=Rhizophagus irregularis TaxID=588596 RepID=A0A2N0NTD2_9GLOM|nr:hypothetical protein RhiirA5_432418 [Rhizophagus irregularis]
MSSNSIKIEIDNNNIGSTEKIESDDNKSPHNGKPITKVEISPNEEYLVTYSENDHSIVVWNIKNKGPHKPELFVPLSSHRRLFQIAISNDKKLAHINSDKYLETYDTENNNNKIKLDCDDNYKYCYCTFNLEGEFMSHEVKDNMIYIYSTETKNNKWNCKRMYKIPEDFNIIDISEYNIYLFSNNTIYEHNLITEKTVRIFKSNEMIIYNTSYNKRIRIFSNEKLIYIRINNKFVIYSIEFEIPFTLLYIDNIDNDIQLRNFMYRNGLIPYLISLINYDIIKELYWNECLDLLKEKGQLSKEFQTENLLNKIRTKTKYAFGIQGGHILKIKHKEVLATMNLKSEIPNEIIDWYLSIDVNNVNINKKTYETHILLNNNSQDTIYALFREININNYEELELTQNLIVWKINFGDGMIKLRVYNKDKYDTDKCDAEKEPIPICVKVENISADQYLLGTKLFNDSDIIVLTTKGLFIYNFNEIKQSISLSYLYCMNIAISESHKIDNKDDIVKQLKEVFSKPTLPLSNYDSLKGYDGWVSYIKDNKERLLKYGVELLKFAIEEHKLDLIEDIYKKCMNYYKDDLENNRMFLSIITSTIPLLSKCYPDYISRYSSETTMITDSSFYSIEYKNNNSHLYSTSEYPQIINLTKSIWWCKYNLLISKFVKEEIFKHKKTTTIMFMNPYIKFINYPQEYNWFKELIKSQPSPFVETINQDIYKTWDGEALIDFKWNNYGKYYYTLIWIVYIVFLGCFTAAATIPQQQYIDEDTQNQLLIASIILGFIHLSFEIRQFIYDPIRWLRNFWNIFGNMKVF